MGEDAVGKQLLQQLLPLEISNKNGVTPQACL